MIASIALLIHATAPAGAPAGATGATINHRSVELFERDWVLMHWGVRYFDRDGDGLISPGEAHVAALAFKAIADGDADGRVTPYEYDRAREFIIARY